MVLETKELVLRTVSFDNVCFYSLLGGKRSPQGVNTIVCAKFPAIIYKKQNLLPIGDASTTPKRLQLKSVINQMITPEEIIILLSFFF